MDENAFTAYNNNKFPIIKRGIVEITVINSRNRVIALAEHGR
jgi:hypothetical protein